MNKKPLIAFGMAIGLPTCALAQVSVTFGEPVAPVYAAPAYAAPAYAAPVPDYPTYHYDHHRHRHDDYWREHRVDEHFHR